MSKKGEEVLVIEALGGHVHPRAPSGRSWVRRVEKREEDVSFIESKGIV